MNRNSLRPFLLEYDENNNLINILMSGCQRTSYLRYWTGIDNKYKPIIDYNSTKAYCLELTHREKSILTTEIIRNNPDVWYK